MGTKRQRRYCPLPNKGARYRHGKSKTRVYRIWQGILQRCKNPDYHGYRFYGARGIEVCERWLTFENFYADMGDPPQGRSIDRIDNDGNYEPGNCRWATASEQALNKSIAVLVTAFGKTQSIDQWAEETGLKRRTIEGRLERGWRHDDAVGLSVKEGLARVSPPTGFPVKKSKAMFTAFGETKTMKNWSRDDRCIVSYSTLVARIQRAGWSPEAAVTTPPDRIKRAAGKAGNADLWGNSSNNMA